MKIPFDVKYRSQIESGEYSVVTGDDKPVRIICWDRHYDNQHPIVALAYDAKKDIEIYINASVLGEALSSLKGDNLFIVTPEPELTEFEQGVRECVTKNLTTHIKDGNGREMSSTVFINDDTAKKIAAELLSLAREQFIKDGYIIEKKAFHDAIENISDKHLAEMSVKYSIHCKVEDGTRHAIMNWKEFQKVAQNFIDIGKAEALKDLPRWETIKKDDNAIAIIPYVSTNMLGEKMLYIGKTLSQLVVL